jgi:hypothetical protein
LEINYKVVAEKVIDPATIGSINPMFRVPGTWHPNSWPLKKYCVDCEKIYDLDIEFCECGLELLRKRIFKKRNVFANPVSEDQLDGNSAEEILKDARNQIVDLEEFWTGSGILKIDRWDKIITQPRIKDVSRVNVRQQLPACFSNLMKYVEDHKKRFKLIIGLKELGWSFSEVLNLLDKINPNQKKYSGGNEYELGKLYSGEYYNYKFNLNCHGMRFHCPQDGDCSRFHPVY